MVSSIYTVRLKPNIRKMLDIIAKQTDRKPSDTIRHLIQQAYNELQSQTQMEYVDLHQEFAALQAELTELRAHINECDPAMAEYNKLKEQHL